MIRFLTLFFVLFASFNCEIVHQCQWGAKLESYSPHPAKQYSINLEDSYTQRWSQIAAENKQDLLNVISLAQRLYAPIGCDDLPDSVFEGYDPEFAAEIEAFAKLLEVPTSYVFWLNVMYEAYTYCTSVVVQDENNLVFSGRNLDYDFTTPIARVAYHINYYKDGKVFFRANVLGGFIGFITAEKPGKFSISANQRTSPNVNKMQLWDRILGRGINFMELFLNKRTNLLMNVRRVLENAETYQEAIEMLTNNPTIAPAYYIVSGVRSNEGAVITSGRDGIVNVTTLDVENGVWFLAQTNYDRDIPDPKNDNRRTAAEQKINEIGRSNITMQNLLDNVLAQYPNFNAITIVSATFSSSLDYFNATVWID